MPEDSTPAATEGAVEPVGTTESPIVSTAVEVTGTTPITIPMETEYSQKPWFGELLKNEDPGQALLKQHDSLLSKLGQGGKNTPPSDPTDRKAWDEYYASMRPQSAEEYSIGEFVLPEGDEAEAAYKDVYDHLNETLSPEYKTFVQGVFDEAGITKAQADILAGKLNEYALKSTKDQYDQQKAAVEAYNKEFDTLKIRELGPTADAQIAEAHKILKKYVPDEVRKFNQRLDNEAAIQLALNMKHVMKAYGMEDGKPGGGGQPAGGGGQSLEQVNAEYQAWFADNHQALGDFTNAKHKLAVQQEAEFSNRIKALTQKS